MFKFILMFLALNTYAFTASESHAGDPTHINFDGDQLAPGISAVQSKISLDTSKFIWSKKSLRWDWKSRSSITFKRPIPWVERSSARKANKHPMPVENCFVVWIYNKKPNVKGELRFSFGKGNKEVCSFKFKLNFSGWRTAWVSYDRDMDGAPQEALDYVKIEAPKTKSTGPLWIGDILTHRLIDRRHQHGDYQVPFVNGADKLKSGPCDPIMYWYDQSKKAFKRKKVTAAHLEAFEKLRNRNLPRKVGSISAQNFAELERKFNRYQISQSKDGIRGDHIYLAYQAAGIPKERSQPGHKVRAYTTFMLELAKAWNSLPEKGQESEQGRKLSEMFCLMTEHLLDQGFAAGSSLGTMNLFGYATRSWAPAIALMQGPLAERKLLLPAQQALAWYYNSYKAFTPAHDSADMDYINTLATSDLLIHSIGADDHHKLRRLSSYSRWLSATLSAESPGSSGGFKPDGSLFHHKMHYHGYGIPALTKVSLNVVAPLDGTPFEISPKAYAALKRSFLAAQYWAYPYGGWNSCGRHPLSVSLNGTKAALLALAKSKPGTDEVDTELAAMYLAIFAGDSQKLFARDIKAKQVSGFHAMNYNASLSYKFSDNTVHIKGFGDGIISHETYKKDNRYGRYFSYASVQVFKNTQEHKNGYNEEGWDWSKIPATTSLLLPPDVLEGNSSFYGSRPKQKTYPSGAGSLAENYGAFLFQLDQTADPESLQMRKSVFCIDDKIICLGSNINNASQKYPTITTLFQNSKSSPLHKTANTERIGKSHKRQWMIDCFGTGYFFKQKQNVRIYDGEQKSKHNKTKKETTGLFTSAWIDHGKAPKDAKYRYGMILNADAQKMTSWAKRQSNKKTAIKVLQQDNQAHIIYSPQDKVTAAAFFTAFESEKPSSLIQAVDRSCIVIAQRRKANKLKLSVTDIDLADIGQKANSARAQVVIKGRWKLDRKSSKKARIKRSGDQSIMQIFPTRGESVELSLVRIQ